MGTKKKVQLRPIDFDIHTGKKKRWHWRSAAITLIRSPSSGEQHGKALEKTGFAASMFYEHPEIYSEEDCKRYVDAFYGKDVSKWPEFKKHYYW